MTKFVVSILAAASLVACVDSASDPQPSSDGTYTVGDRTLKLVEGIPEPGQNFSPSPTLNLAGCWVVLDWCSEPGTGDAVCHFTNCTIERAVDACLDLIEDTCGLN